MKRSINGIIYKTEKHQNKLY